MKIAKKVLAVVMALAMIAGLSAMAFAAEGTYVLTSANEDEYLVVTVTLKGGEGATADKFVVEYDPAVLTIEDKNEDVVLGKDVKEMSKANAQSQLSGLPNANDDGKVVFGYTFAKTLSNKDITPAKGETISIDPNNFEFVKIYFKVLDEDATTTIKVVSEEGYKGSTLTIGESKTPVTPAPTENTTAEDGTKPANPGTGNKPTGDNMALAAAAGVALLAGAAFIVSKKRK